MKRILTTLITLLAFAFAFAPAALAYDINADGQPDYVWHDLSTGKVNYWLCNGTGGVTSFGEVDGATMPSPSWVMAGVHDNGTNVIITFQSQTNGTLEQLALNADGTRNATRQVNGTAYTVPKSQQLAR